MKNTARKYFVVKLPADPSLKPNIEAAIKLVEKLREVHASPAIIEVAEQAAKAAQEAEAQEHH